MHTAIETPAAPGIATDPAKDAANEQRRIKKMMSFETTTWGFGGGLSPLMTVLIAVFAVLFVGAIGRGIWVWIKNNRSPVQTVNARVVAKRMKVSGHGHAMAGHAAAMQGLDSSTCTRYFATFEMENGKRLELSVKDSEYGMLAEGDRGRFSFQGTRYLGFEQA